MKFNFMTKLSNAKTKLLQGFYSRLIQIPTEMNTADFLNAYGENGWLYACICSIARGVADTEWKAYTKKGDQELENSMALSVLKKPNPFFTLYDTLELTSIYMDLIGKAYWYISKDAMGRAREIWVVNPRYIKIIPDFQDHIKGYLYNDGASVIPLDPDEIIMFKLPDPNNPYRGVSPTKAAASTIESDKYASQWNRNFFYNNAEPQGVIEVAQGLSDPEYERLKESWNEQYGGLSNAKKTAILEGGATYKQIQVNQKDMDFYNLRGANRDEILATFGVPKSILGIVENVNRSNAETSEYTFAKHTLSPRLKKMVDKINNEFVPLFGEDIILKPNDIIPENKEYVKSILDTQTDKSITKNEARQVLSKLLNIPLAPMEGGDVIYQVTSLQPMGAPDPASMQVGIAQQQLEGQQVLQSHQIEQDKADREQAQKDKEEAQQKEKEEALNAPQPGDKSFTIAKSVRKKVAKALTDNDEVRHTQFLKTADKLTEDIASTLNKYLKRMQKEVVANIRDGSKDPVDTVKWDKELVEIMTPHITKCFISAGDNVVKEFKSLEGAINKELGVEFNYKDPDVLKAIINKVNKSKIINQLTKEEINKIIEETYSPDNTNLTGLDFTIEDIANKINDANFKLFTLSRARTVAQTETLSAVNQGTLKAYSQNSHLIDGKYWLNNHDTHVRESHSKAGSIYNRDNSIPVTDDFVVGGHSCKCPGDGNLPAGEVVNCRCCMAPMVKV